VNGIETQVLAAAMALLAVTASGAQAQPSQPAPHVSPDLIGEGRRFAQSNCSRCHAIGRHERSPNSDAPPLRTLSQSYPISSLDEAFAEGAFVGHSNMPEFRLTPRQIDALTAYLESVQAHPSASR